MPLINTSLPNLVQGVSQQPDSMRFEGQCEEQINALSSVADGLKKRPNTRYFKNLISSAIAEGAFVHFINRDKNERYVVIINNNTIQAFDLIAGGYPVTIGGSSSVTIGSSDYLYLSGSKKPIDYIKALTVGDNTFLLNTDKTVARKTSPSDKSATHVSSAATNKALIFIKQGDYKTRYNIKIKQGSNTFKASYGSGDAAGSGTGVNSQAGLIAKKLRDALLDSLDDVTSNGGFTLGDVEGIGTGTNETIVADDYDTGGTASRYLYPLFEISRADGNAFEITVSDSKSGTALGVAYKEVGAISDLPKVAPDGFKIKVRGDAEAGEDD